MLFRLLFMFLLFALGRVFGPGGSRGTFGNPGNDQKLGSKGGGDRRAGGAGRPGGRSTSSGNGGTKPPLDRSDVVDVPFTDVPPSGGAPDAGPATGAGTGPARGAPSP